MKYRPIMTVSLRNKHVFDVDPYYCMVFVYSSSCINIMVVHHMCSEFLDYTGKSANNEYVCVMLIFTWMDNLSQCKKPRSVVSVFSI